MRLFEIEPDADAARRIDLQPAVVLDVAELLGRRVVENENDGRYSLRQIEILVEHVGHVHRPVAAIVQQLEILAELPALARVQSVIDRKSTRLNSSHLGISYAVFCLKKK